MKQCPQCFESFDPSISRQVYCSDECRGIATKEKQAASNRTKQKKRKRCASRKCNNFVSENTDSIFCISCFLDQATIEKDLKRIKRYSNA